MSEPNVFVSTRDTSAVRIEQAIMSGTAPDGGLYVPEALPSFAPGQFATDAHFGALAKQLLSPFFIGSSLEDRLGEVCTEALNFPVPLRTLEEGDAPLGVLELFHGPTAAFKDVGARFLASSMARIIDDGQFAKPPVTILVATSGDTGGAVAAAFHRKPGLRVVVLFPDGRVSARQQHQLTCWGDNVISLAVRGEFDDCQRLVKQAFADPELSRAHRLCSANSINVGRLLPQSAYYAKTSLDIFHATGEQANFIIPTGNLGNGFACVWAKRMGMPIGRIIFATNANTTVPDFLNTGDWTPAPSKATLASAMDVGDPSNMERLRALCGDATAIRREVAAMAVSDDEIRATLIDEYQRHKIAWCPHTATGLFAYRKLSREERQNKRWVVVATAHAAKFDAIVEPLLNIRIDPPAELKELLTWPAEFDTIPAELSEIAGRL